MKVEAREGSVGLDEVDELTVYRHSCLVSFRFESYPTQAQLTTIAFEGKGDDGEPCQVPSLRGAGSQKVADLESSPPRNQMSGSQLPL